MSLNAGILTARKRVTVTRQNRKTYAKPLLVLALLCFSFATGWAQHKPETVIKTHTIYKDRPVAVFIPIPTSHNKKYVQRQIDLVAAALPASALAPPPASKNETATKKGLTHVASK
jgi:hypothetical protein